MGFTAPQHYIGYMAPTGEVFPDPHLAQTKQKGNHRRRIERIARYESRNTTPDWIPELQISRLFPSLLVASYDHARASSGYILYVTIYVTSPRATWDIILRRNFNN